MLKSTGLIEIIKHEKFGALGRIFKRIFFTYWSSLIHKSKPKTVEFQCMFIDHIATEVTFMVGQVELNMWVKVYSCFNPDILLLPAPPDYFLS